MATVEDKRQWLRMLFVLSASDKTIANRRKAFIKKATLSWDLTPSDYQWAKSEVLERKNQSLYQPVDYESLELLFDALVKLAVTSDSAIPEITPHEMVVIEFYADKLAISEADLKSTLVQAVTEFQEARGLASGKIKMPSQSEENPRYRREPKWPAPDDPIETEWPFYMFYIAALSGPITPLEVTVVTRYSDRWKLNRDVLIDAQNYIKRGKEVRPIDVELSKKHRLELFEALCHAAILKNKLTIDQLKFLQEQAIILGEFDVVWINKLYDFAGQIHNTKESPLEFPPHADQILRRVRAAKSGGFAIGSMSPLTVSILLILSIIVVAIGLNSLF